jgi:hypothetical protein
MKFKSPGGELNWMTPLCMIFGIYLAYDTLVHGENVLVGCLYGAIGLFSALIWFDLKWAAIPLLVYFAFAVLAGTFQLIAIQFIWLKLFKLLSASYFAFELWQWRAGVELEKSQRVHLDD